MGVVTPSVVCARVRNVCAIMRAVVVQAMLGVSFVALIIGRTRVRDQLAGYARYVVCCIQDPRVAHVPGVDIGIRDRYVSTLAHYATIFTKAIVPVKSDAVASCVDKGTQFLHHVPVLDVICCMLMKTVLSLNHGV